MSLSYQHDVTKTHNYTWTTSQLFNATEIAGSSSSSAVTYDLGDSADVPTLHIFVSITSGASNSVASIERSPDDTIWYSGTEDDVTVDEAEKYAIVNDPGRYVRVTISNQDESAITVSLTIGFYGQ